MERLRSPYVQDHYPDDFAYCYGCGRNNGASLGFRTRWDGEETVTEYTPRPEHIALPGFVYGGLIASLIDCHSTGSASLAHLRRQGHEPEDGVPAPRFVTASLKVDFLRPTPHGGPLVVRGRIVEVGERKVVVESTLYASGAPTVRGWAVLVLAPATMVAAGRTGGADAGDGADDPAGA